MWKLKADERLIRWRDFRNNLGVMSLDDALIETVQLWDTAPFTPYYLDSEKNEDWPDPWTLITDNYYCDIAKALGIIYTICFSEHGSQLNAELRIYQDLVSRYNYNLAFFNDGKYVINMIPGEVVNNSHIDNTLKLLYRFSSDDLKLKQY
jgi:hypothetical protein